MCALDKEYLFNAHPAVHRNQNTCSEEIFTDRTSGFGEAATEDAWAKQDGLILFVTPVPPNIEISCKKGLHKSVTVFGVSEEGGKEFLTG